MNNKLILGLLMGIFVAAPLAAADPSEQQKHLFTALKTTLKANPVGVPPDAKRTVLLLVAPLLDASQLDAVYIAANNETTLGDEDAVKAAVEKEIPQNKAAYVDRFKKTIQENITNGIAAGVKKPVQLAGEGAAAKFDADEIAQMKKALQEAAAKF